MRPRRGGVVVPSLAAGVALALSLPPFGLWPLAFVGAGLIYWRLRDLRLRARLLAGWSAGLGCYGIGLYWARTFNWYGAVVLVVVEALFMAVAGALTTNGPWRLASFVGSFTLLEAARMAWPFGGIPIGGVFLGQAQGPLLATARLGGPLLLTALVWTLGALLEELGARALRLASQRLPASGRTGLLGWVRTPAQGSDRPAIGRPAMSRPAMGRPAMGSPAMGRGPLVAAVIVAALLAGSVLSPDGGRPVRLLRVVAVQGGGQRGLSKSEVNQASVFAAQLAATRLIAQARATAAGGGSLRASSPELVVWPEDVISLERPLIGSPQERTMSALARRLHATLVAGVTYPASATTFRNEIVAWSSTGRIVSVFEKVHRVPFGEYVPFRSFFSHFASLSGVPLDAIPGDESGLMRTPAAPIGVLVSYEVFFSNRSLPSVGAGAQLLVVPTNTSSYSTSQVPSQEVAADRIQAVEEGRDLVQAAPTGYSTIVNNLGQVLEQSALSKRQVLVATVGLRTGKTVYEQIGDDSLVALAALLAAAGLVLNRRGRDSKQRGSLVVPGMDVDAGNSLPDEHGVVGGIVLQGKP